jgi:hypothetical protein
VAALVPAVPDVGVTGRFDVGPVVGADEETGEHDVVGRGPADPANQPQVAALRGHASANPIRCAAPSSVTNTRNLSPNTARSSAR